MATLFTDGFWGAEYDDINEAGTRSHLWSYHESYGGSAVRFYLISPGTGTISRRVHTGQPGSARATVDPPTPDYSVTVDYCLFSNLPSLRFGPTVRHHTLSDNYYGVYYQDGELVLFVRVDGVDTTLDTWSNPLAYGSGTTPVVYTLRLEANGTAIGAYLNGELRVSATDNTLTSVGRPGIQGRATHPTAYSGIHIDNYTVTDDTTLSTERVMVAGIVGL